MPKPKVIPLKRRSLLPPSNVRRRGPPGAPGGTVPASFDLSAYASGKPDSGEILIRYVFTSDIVFPEDFVDSYGVAIDASTGMAIFSVEKNGIEIGTVAFTDDDFAEFSTASEITFAAGDILSLVAPSPANSTLSDISITFKGSKNG